MSNVPKLAGALALNAAVAAGCASAPQAPQTAPQVATTAKIQKDTSTRALVSVIGAPITMACDVSVEDTEGMKVAKAKTAISACNEKQTKSFFTCSEDSRMEADERGLYACLEDKYASVKEMDAECFKERAIAEPVARCDARVKRRTIKWECYDGPRY